MLLPVARVAVAALAGSLVYNVGRNVIETRNVMQLSSNTNNRQQPSLLLPSNEAPTIPQTVTELSQLSRKELLDLYCNHCSIDVASIQQRIDKNNTDNDYNSDISSFIDGEWNGVLLNNNGLTWIAKFITNFLFSGRGIWRRRTWNGKAFYSNGNDNVDNNKQKIGWNRFDTFTIHRGSSNKNRSPSLLSSSTLKSTTSQLPTTTVILKTEQEHRFDYDIEPSRLDNQNPSVIVRYNAYQGKFSPWKNMIDEIRVLPIQPQAKSSSIDQKQQQYDILIGLGSMRWSGGIYNCSPFCLFRRRQNQHGNR